jgi:hypothetical protein
MNREVDSTPSLNRRNELFPDHRPRLLLPSTERSSRTLETTQCSVCRTEFRYQPGFRVGERDLSRNEELHPIKFLYPAPRVPIDLTGVLAEK